MGEAFERACKSLHDMGQPDIVKEIIAKRIVEVAKTGERDPVQLCERALAALGLKPRDWARSLGERSVHHASIGSEAFVLICFRHCPTQMRMKNRA
jgi:hypothetical protein